RDTAPTMIYTLSLHDALPICRCGGETIDLSCVAEQQRRVVTAICVTQAASRVVVNAKEKSRITIIRAVFHKQSVYRLQEPRQVFERDGVLAAQVGLQVRHQ